METNSLKVKSLILKGKTVEEILALVPITAKAVYYHFKRLGIPVKGKGSGGQNAKVKHNPFTNSKESLYWIGFILADGHISKTKYSIRVGQKEEDKDILFKFDKFVNASLTKVKHYYTVKSGETKCMLYSSFGNKEAHTYLKTLGFTSNKGLTMDLQIPLTWEIVAGWFDGDGSVTFNDAPRRQAQIKITTGSYTMVQKLVEFLQQNKLMCYVLPKGRAFDILLKPESRVSFAKQLNVLNVPRLSRKYRKLASLIEILG